MKDIQIIFREIHNGRFTVSQHARERMAQRAITLEDILNIVRTCYEQKWQEDKETYRFMGYLTDGDKGGVVAVYRNGVVIVTVLDRRKGR